MNKIVSTKNTNAIFLAIVLVTGTITLSIPSFMVGAQAQEYYGMEKDYKKSDKKDVTVKSVKCNNVNVNVNGLELTVLPPTLANLLSSGDEGERGAASYGSNGYGNGGSYDNGQSGSDGDFKFVCINNNNNTVVSVNETTPEPEPEPLTCEECFEEFLSPDEITTFEELFGSPLDRFWILFTNPENELVILEDDFRMALPGVDTEDIDNLIDCLENEGVVFIQDTPPI